MNAKLQGHRGFSLIELVAVVVILGVIAVTAMSKFGQTASQQVQARSDDLVSAVSVAQQLAMTQTDRIQLLASGSQIDIQEDNGGYTSVRAGGLQYPLDISPVVLEGGPYAIEFDRLGRVISPTTPVNIALRRGSASRMVTVSASGFAQ